MKLKLENEKFTAEFSTLGAELISLNRKSDKTEYIWDGNEKVWKSHAPILFPFVARCLGGHFLIEGKKCEYTKNHGFARDLEWTVLEQSATKVTFILTQSEETLYRYPYSFNLTCDYELVENGLNWKLSVKNTDTKSFKFSIGTHAAFCCPRNTDETGTSNSDYVVEFQNKEALQAVPCTADGYIAVSEDRKAPYTKAYGEKDAGIIPLNKEGFGNGHLFTNFTSEWVGLRNKKDNSLISISTKGFPYCMIWQNTQGDPSFICIEPWHGIPDTENTSHIWDEKAGLIELAAGKTFDCIQNIRIS